MLPTLMCASCDPVGCCADAAYPLCHHPFAVFDCSAIGGTMCSPRSAEAPEFWLHHSNVDRIWALWQRRSNAHLTAFQTTASFPGSMSRGVRPNAVTNLDNHLGISVTYSGFQTSMPSLGEAPDNGTEEEQWANNARLWETMLRVTQQQSSQGLGPN
eukprot:m.230928 g.230928  ORF g.230928 m.230928 type:complete len:157 (+) comp18862_c1_seq6:900-1370(+)